MNSCALSAEQLPIYKRPILHDRDNPRSLGRHLIPDTHVCELHVGEHLIWESRDAEKMRRERAASARAASARLMRRQ